MLKPVNFGTSYAASLDFIELIVRSKLSYSIICTTRGTSSERIFMKYFLISLYTCSEFLALIRFYVALSDSYEYFSERMLQNWDS
jgi:hypothetical protein